MVGTVRIELRKGVAGKHGKTPLSLIYSLGGVRKRFSLNLVIHPEYWDVQGQKAVYLSKDLFKLHSHLSAKDFLIETEIRAINRVFEKYKLDIEGIESKFKALKVPFSSQTVIDELKVNEGQLTKKEEVTDFVFDFMDRYIQDHQAVREKGSLTVYSSVKNHLKAYQDHTGHKVTFEKIDHSFFHNFQTFLVNRTKTDKAGVESPLLNNTTIAKALSTLKTFLSYARKHGIIVNDSYKVFTIKKEKLEVIALTQQELDKLINLDLSENKRLEKARDIFCFAAATGLRYSDVAQLKREHINNGYITLTIKKTKSVLKVPLTFLPATILEKYKDSNKPLPMVSNQNLNYSIKDLCQLAGINQPIEIVRYHGKKRVVKTYPKYELVHFHTARKTFVTHCLERGLSTEVVMEMTGHSDYKSFARYSKVTEERMKVEMLRAFGAPSLTHLKVV